ncbi:hypothetical protein GCM10010339_10750 [Streptomyces alanosinicus]|uniref:HAD family hydrolase n=1 Tax=Streptomyces alanosinicus TaxID=68171 RepID=A0A918YEN6_9ACTN|nr:hypothetical protein GCM10010339_10750 [Streptomyces alanosinicus]
MAGWGGSPVGACRVLLAHPCRLGPDNLMGRAWSAVPTARRMAALARAAKSAGYRLALLSNSFGMDPFNPYEQAGIWGLFEVHIISEQVRTAKPDPAIYELTLERLGLPAQACVFVDDHPRNLPPAEALGITTVLATDEAATVAELEALLGVSAARSVSREHHARGCGCGGRDRFPT